jgi:hypothetical protein
VILSLLTLRGLRISELCALERGLVNLGVGVIQTSRSKTAAGYREIDIIFAALHQDLAEHLARPTAFGRSRDPLVPSGNGNRLVASNIRQRVVAKVVAEANELLRERGAGELGELRGFCRHFCEGRALDNRERFGPCAPDRDPGAQSRNSQFAGT